MDMVRVGPSHTNNTPPDGDPSERHSVGDLASLEARTRLRQTLAATGLALFCGVHGEERMEQCLRPVDEAGWVVPSRSS